MATAKAKAVRQYEVATSVPAAPTNVSATTPAWSYIDLAWSDVQGDFGYKIDRSLTGTSGWQQVGSTGANTTIFKDRGLTPSTRYYYRIKSFNRVGDSAPSPTATTSTKVAKPPPQNLIGSALDARRIHIAWTDAIGEIGYLVERSTNGGPWTQIRVLGGSVVDYHDENLSPATRYDYRVRARYAEDDSLPSNVVSIRTAGPPAAITDLRATSLSQFQIRLDWTDVDGDTGYRVQRSLNGVDGWTELIITANSAISFLDESGLVAGTTYHYRVLGKNSAGDALPSNPASATTAAPDAPIALSGEARANNQVYLQWLDVNFDSGYKIERSPNGSTGWTQILTNGPNDWDAVDSTVSIGNTYFYRVRAKGGTVDGPYSAVASVRYDRPDQPQGLVIWDVGANYVVLHWTDVNGDFGYRIERSPDGSSNWSEVGEVPASVTDFRNSELAANTTYHYRVKARSWLGDSDPSTSVFVTTGSLAAPASFAARTVSSSQIDLTWQDVDGDIGYQIERSLTGTGNWDSAWTVGGSVTSYSDTAVSPGTTYYYRIKALYPNGGQSSYSGVSSASTSPAAPAPAPPAPSGLTAVPVSASQIDLAWNDVTGEDQYTILRSLSPSFGFAEVATRGANTVSYRDSGLSGGTTYYYYVRADKLPSSFSAWSNQASATTTPSETQIDTPTIQTYCQQGTSRATISWNGYPDGRGSGGYIVDLDYADDGWDDGSHWNKSVSPPAVSPQTDAPDDFAANGGRPAIGSSLEGGRQYRVRVYYAATGHRSPDALFTARSTCYPSTPQGLAASAESSTTVRLTWGDVSDEYYYKVTRYDPTTGTWPMIGTTGQDETSFLDINLTPVTTYRYRVAAANSFGDSSLSNEASATTRADTAAGGSLTAPDTLVAAATSAEIELDWEDVDGNSAFRVERSLSGSSGWQQVGSVGANETIFTDSQVTADRRYYYRVFATDGPGATSPASATTSCSTKNYENHRLYCPEGGSNEHKVYISPGHFSHDPRPFPCGGSGEWAEAWETGLAVKDRLLNWNYEVLMPKKAFDVGYTERVNAAYDWFQQDAFGNVEWFTYLAIHSNAHGVDDYGCGHAHGGTQLLHHKGLDIDAGQGAYSRLAGKTPGAPSEHEQKWDVCSFNPVYELGCNSEKPDHYPVVYVEVEYHDTNQGADWIRNNNDAAARALATGLDCYLARFSAAC